MGLEIIAEPDLLEGRAARVPDDTPGPDYDPIVETRKKYFGGLDSDHIVQMWQRLYRGIEPKDVLKMYQNLSGD